MNKVFPRRRGEKLTKKKEVSTSFSGEESALTSYFRQLGDSLEPVSGPRFDCFWSELKRVIKRELHRRGLWQSPPIFVGLEFAEVWDDKALEELATDCYAFLMQRLRTLHQHLKLKPNIDGLIVLNVRHFLYERQKRCDPLGFRIFDLVRVAVRQAVEEGTLWVAAGNPKIENTTLLQPPSHAGRPESLAQGASYLQERCRGWVDDLLPELILARGRQRRLVEARLQEYLATLDQREVGAFSFKVLVDGLKAAARVRWRAVWAQEGDEIPPSIAIQQNDAESGIAIVFQKATFEDEESFRLLVAKVTEAVESAPANLQHRKYLPALWDFLRTSSADPAVDAVPSRRRVAELLGIPRYLLPELYSQLGKMIDRCREAQPTLTRARRQSGRGGR